MKTTYVWQILKLTRMPIVLAVLPTFLVGVLFALKTGHLFSLENFLWGFTILFIIEIAASFANDYFDYEADKHNKQFGFSGGSGVLLNYPELRIFAKHAAILLFSVALIATGFFTWQAALPVWTIGYIAVAVFFCWFYTAPPLKLVYRGLGEAPHLLAGVMFPGWGYLIMTRTLDINLFFFAIPFGLLGLTVILNFELPDREADIHAFKHNLVVRFDRYPVFIFIMILYLLTTAYIAILVLMQWYTEAINFHAITVILLMPFVFSTYAVFKKPVTHHAATRYSLLNAISGFIAVLMITFILLM